MMNRIVHIALVALAATAGAATVPQRSAADYVFVTPVLTNHIRGVVIDVTNAYGVIRSEDVDWFREAMYERISLKSGHIARGSGVGAPVKRGDLPLGILSDFWNGFPRGTDDGWLDPSAPIHDGVRLYGYDAAPVTNVYTRARASIVGTVTNAVSVITMPMTNGTTSVYTNQWSARFDPIVNETVTNVHAWTSLDYCLPAGAGIFGGLTNTPYGDRAAYTGIGHAPTIAALSNMCERLRGTKRLADVGYWPTNRLVTVSRERLGETVYPPSTNAYGSIVYALSTHTQTNGWSSSDETRSDPGLLYIYTRFDSALCTTGGASRVAVEALYADVHFTYSYSDDRNPASDIYISTNAVVRLADPVLDLTGPCARVTVSYDAKAVCSAVASASGLPAVPSSGVAYVPENGISLGWSVAEPVFNIIYSVTPYAKLPDW